MRIQREATGSKMVTSRNNCCCSCCCGCSFIQMNGAEFYGTFNLQIRAEGSRHFQ